MFDASNGARFRHIQTLVERIAGLRQATEPDRNPEVDAALVELKSSLGQLHINQEELSGQDQQLESAGSALEVERQREARLGQVSSQVTASLELPVVMREVLAGACTLTGAQYGALRVFDAAGSVQQFLTHGVAPHEQETDAALPHNLDILEWLHQQRRPVRVTDLSALSLSLGFPPEHPPVRAILGVPLRLADEALGDLYLAEKVTGGEFTQEDEELLTRFASQAAQAIYNALMYQREQSARAQAEAKARALAASEERFRLLAENARDLIYRHRLAPEPAVEYVSPSAITISGYAPEEFYANPGLCLELAHPDDRALAERVMKDPSSFPEPTVIRWTRKDQTLAWVEFTVVPRCNEGGAPVAIEGIVRDVTARQRVEEALRDSEARFRDLVENTNDILWEVDAECRYTYCSPNVASIIGYQPEELLGQTPFDTMPPEEAQRVAALFAPILAGQQPFSLLTHGTLCKGGQLRVMECSGQPIFDQQECFRGYRGVQRDITERKRAEDALEKERQRLARFVDTSPVGIIIAEASGEISLLNREAQRILGVQYQPGGTLDWYAQRVPFARPDGQPLPLEETPVRRALYYGETVRAQEVLFKPPDGPSIHALYNATPVYSPDGQITSAIAVIQDMTALDEAEKLRSEFLGMVSHELRTPLTAIKGAAATALSSRRQLDEGETQELFKIVNEQVTRLNNLVSNLLDLTRVEAGVLSVNPEPVDIRSVAEDGLAAFRRSDSRYDVRLRAPHDLPLVRADRLRVEQVLANLLGNAAKFSPPASPIVVALEHDPIYVTVQVQDYGQGIPRDRLPDLFKKFSQVHSTDRAGADRRLAGAGLGLTICKGIVEAHGGRIWADSPGEGKGATFSFTLPVAPGAPLLSLPDPRRRAHQTGRVSRPTKRMRILAVDDDHHMLRLLRRLLDEAEYEVMITTDPSEAMKFVELEEPDLVLLDLMFPGSSGLDLVQEIREFSEVPVILVSAVESEETRVRGLRLGADDYITKPFSPPELLARVETALRRRALTDQADTRPPFALEDLMINFAERQVTKGGRVVYLSSTEYKLLHQLAIHAGRVLTHEQLLKQVWGPEYSGESELLRSMIRNLRRKLGDSGRRPRYILTEAQVGYRMATP